MRRVSVRYAGLTCFLFLSINQVGTAEDPPFARVRERIERAVAGDRIPSLAVAVAKDGRIIWEEGFGWADKEKQLRATPHTPYSIASISKPITATGLMVLVNRGLVDLDRPINDYLGDAKLTAHVGNVADATVRRVANHSAGLPLHYQFFYADEPRRVPDFDESIRRYGHLLAPPGEEFQYANFGFGVLDQVVQRVGKRDFAGFLRQELFEPLGMRHTAVGIDPQWEPPAAVRYGEGHRPLPFYDFDHPGASAVFSSAHDLALFGLFQLGQPTSEQKVILSEKAVREMQRPTVPISNRRHYGVGWFIDEKEYGYHTVSHSGGMGGVRCRLVFIPAEKIVVVTLCNASTDFPMQIAKEILAELLPDYGVNLRKESDDPSTADPPRPSAPPELVGFWQGDVETYEGRRRLELWVHPDGDVKVRFAGQLLTLLNQSQLKDGLLTGLFAGHLNTADANRRPHQLHVRLRLRGEVLNGALTAISLPGRKPGNALSHWAELRRVDRDPQVISMFNGHGLDGWRVIEKYDFEQHGLVHVEDGAIILDEGRPATGISWGGAPPRMNYELSLEAKRLAGSDFFCGLTFPVGPQYLSLILGGWGGGVTGLSNLDGNSAVENETTGYRDFQNDRWYAVRLRVTPGQVTVWLDGESIVDVKTADHKLSIWWEQEPVRPLGIASWYTKAALRNIRLKRLADAAAIGPKQ